MIEDIINKEQEFELNKSNKEQKVCCVCMITEKEATEKGLKFVGMNTLYNKEFEDLLGINFSKFNKIKDAYVCNKCIEDTTKIVEKLIQNKHLNEKEEFYEKIDSFTDYILSSSYLFGLDNSIIMQASFNMFDAALENLIETNTEFAKHTIKITLIELERKLHKLEKISSSK